jgi:hypothetical protein
MINLQVSDVQARESIPALILHMFPEGNYMRKSTGEDVRIPASVCFKSVLLSIRPHAASRVYHGELTSEKSAMCDNAGGCVLFVHLVSFRNRAQIQGGSKMTGTVCKQVTVCPGHI